MPSGGVTPAGGAAFNGGTITKGLEIDNPSSSLNGLTIKGALGDTNDTIGPGGELHIAANYGQANDVWALRVDPGAGGSARGLEVRNSSGAAAVWYTDNTAAINSDRILIDFGNGAVSVFAAVDGETPLTLRPHSAADAPLVILSETGTTKASIASTGIVSQKGSVTAAIAAGALPTTTFVSGTGQQILTTRDVFLVVPCTLNPTAGAAGAVAVALSPDNVTYSALATITEPAGIALDGTIIPASLQVPAGWYVKLTATNATIGTGTYY